MLIEIIYENKCDMIYSEYVDVYWIKVLFILSIVWNVRFRFF